MQTELTELNEKLQLFELEPNFSSISAIVFLTKNESFWFKPVFDLDKTVLFYLIFAENLIIFLQFISFLLKTFIGG